MRNILDLIFFLVFEVENLVLFSIGSPRIETLEYVVKCWMETLLSLRRLHSRVSQHFKDIGVRIIQILNWCFIDFQLIQWQLLPEGESSSSILGGQHSIVADP